MRRHVECAQDACGQAGRHRRALLCTGAEVVSATPSGPWRGLFAGFHVPWLVSLCDECVWRCLASFGVFLAGFWGCVQLVQRRRLLWWGLPATDGQQAAPATPGGCGLLFCLHGVLLVACVYSPPPSHTQSSIHALVPYPLFGALFFSFVSLQPPSYGRQHACWPLEVPRTRPKAQAVAMRRRTRRALVRGRM
jgi:hypothetical protein